MPYWIAAPGQTADCAGWATAKEENGDLVVIACHELKQDAIDQAVAISLSEGDPELFKGEWNKPADQVEASDEPVAELRDSGDWEQLNERQQEQAESIAELALKFGMFDQTSGANGAHYAPAEANPFKADGLVCRNCIFFDEINNQCQVVSGPIEPEAVCKLWVIPESEKMTDENRFVDIANNLVQKLVGETRGKQREIRTQDINFEMRAIDETGMRFSGYAAVFNSASRDLGGFVEYIKPGAFARSLASRNKIMLLWNHDTSSPLASTRNGSLTLREDERGLYVEATLPDTTLGRDIAEQVRSGLTDSMSFGFQVKKDSWNPAGNERTLEDVALFEVSLVTSEAYAATAGTASVRNYVATAEKVDIDAEVLAEAMNDFEQGKELSQEKAGVIQAVLEKLTTPSAEETPSADLLAIKRKQFELLLKELDLG